MQLTDGVALSIASAVVSAAVAGYAVRRDAPGARGAAAFSAATAVWAAGNAVQVAATSLDTKLLAVDVQYVGLLVVPIAWFAFAAEYTGRDRWVNRRTVAALSVFPAAMLALVATNDVHHLVRTSATLETTNGVVRLAREFGPGFWVGTAYANLVNSVGTVMLVEYGLRVGNQYRRQTAVVLAGAAVPWLAHAAYLGGTTTVEPEAFFGITAAAFGYAIFRHDFLELAPVARDRVFEALEDGVLVVDGEGRVADHNAAATRLLDGRVAVGEHVDDALPEPVLAALSGDEPGPVRVRGNAGFRWLDAGTTDVGDATAGEVVLLRDVTELQRRRNELDRENERLERVADTISHDLRNPMNVADGYLELAAETGDPEHFDRTRAALERMDDIIDGTLRMARADLHAPEKTDLGLADVAERAWRNVVTDGATLDVDCGDVAVDADPDQLESLLENLFRNSVEHAGSAVTVTVGVDDATAGRQNQGGFYVADDGPGIPEGDRQAVLERGYTTSDAGSGLGLAIVADIAAAHDWTVELSESEGGGVRVNVTGVAFADDSPPEVRGDEGCSEA